MPHTREPDPISSTRSFPACPVCPACGQTMRLVSAMPSLIYTNLDDCRFKCGCGEEADYMVARD